MFSSLGQSQGRRVESSTPRSDHRGPMHFDPSETSNAIRTPKTPYSQGVHRSRNHTPNVPTSRRRSLSAQRRHSHQNHSHQPLFFSNYPGHTIGTHGSSESESVSSAPNLKSGKDFRDPLETTAGYRHSKLGREEGSSHGRRSQAESAQKYIKVARKSIEEMNRAIEIGSQERRLGAVKSALLRFDHTDDAKHNVELQYGAAKVLSKILNVTDDENEIQLVVGALEMVFRAQTNYVHVAFDKCGSVLTPNLLRILERAENGNMKHGDAVILNISKTILYISRVPELRMSLARNAHILAALKRVSSSHLNTECRIIRVRIGANLINCDENKALLLEYKGLLDSLLKVAHLDTSDLAREYAGVALMDLASASENQVTMANNEKLLGTLVKMVLVEKIASTRESAITALQNLAFTKENRLLLVTFKESIVLEALRKALSSDKNDKARRRAAGALTNLACDETAESMGNHKGLLDTLAVVSNKDENRDVQSRAAMALTKLAASISISMGCYSTLLDALVVSSLSQAANGVTTILRVKARDPENRLIMAKHPGILDTLADICISSGSTLKDKDNATRALMHLTNEAANRKIMCNKKVLEALVQGAIIEELKSEDIRDSAIRALERLATDFSNRPYMARHDGLLVAIAKATEREAKLEDAGAKPEHAFLAKPLLMSLLVAM